MSRAGELSEASWRRCSPRGARPVQPEDPWPGVKCLVSKKRIDVLIFVCAGCRGLLSRPMKRISLRQAESAYQTEKPLKESHAVSSFRTAAQFAWLSSPKSRFASVVYSSGTCSYDIKGASGSRRRADCAASTIIARLDAIAAWILV